MKIISKKIDIGKNLAIGGLETFFLISGPCVIENEELTFALAKKIKSICAELQIPFIFKASFDKANRSSLKSFRGPGLKEGLRILSHIKKELNVPILSDVHEPGQVQKAAEVLDIIQIPAFLCRQTDLLLEAARSKKPVNIKKGQFLSPEEMKNVVDKILSQGNRNILLTERGTSFGYNNLVFDVRSIPIMREWGFPVVIDASHSVQKPGGKGTSSGGESRFISYIAKAGISVGAEGLFLETHIKPHEALSDMDNSLNINELHSLLLQLLQIRKTLI